MGSILASAAFALFFKGFDLFGLQVPGIGWRGLFILGAAPALLVFYVQARVPESPVWLAGAANRAANRAARRTRAVAKSATPKSATSGRLLAFLPTFLFLILLMTAFMSFSHGTQDLYPTFLATYAKLTPVHSRAHRCPLRVRIDRRRDCIRHALRAMGPQARHRHRGPAGHPGHSALCLWAFCHHARNWRGAHAVHGSGSMGRGACLPHRAIARSCARYRSWTRLSAGRIGNVMEWQSTGTRG